MERKTIRLLFVAILLLFSSVELSASGSEEIEHSGANITDTASLQRGAKWFMNYCLSCHSVSYMRYNRMAQDLGLSEEMVMENLVFADAKFGDTMEISMRPDHAESWFGNTPPDLSLIGRSRGADWIFAYLRGFYMDETGGWNNTVLPNVSMPHVLWRLQGIQQAVYKTETGESGYSREVFDHFEMVSPGVQTAEEYKETARDIAAFLEYVGEPAKLQRKGVGVWVILFLALFAFLAYLLKAEFWRDIH